MKTERCLASYRNSPKKTYLESGIKKIKLNILPSEKFIVPLENLFKQIHSNSQKLLIKYRKNYRLKNIKITTKANVQNLIIKSRLVTGGLQSSTLLESLIANKPVLLPIFKT